MIKEELISVLANMGYGHKELSKMNKYELEELLDEISDLSIIHVNKFFEKFIMHENY